MFKWYINENFSLKVLILYSLLDCERINYANIHVVKLQNWRVYHC